MCHQNNSTLITMWVYMYGDEYNIDIHIDNIFVHVHIS